ncbi:hypothetical protein KY289_032105 [Solanum tuberosum]|nr:hypothetical protein KY289_032105 [Solanum tuberosum]
MAGIKIDPSDPLYIGPADASGAALIPVKLIGSENYGVWSRSMRIALLGKRKYGFVTGACSRELYRDELHEQWETCNAIVLSWLMSSVNEELLSGIVYATSAYDVWKDLKERFDKVNRMRLYQLHREINSLIQGTDSVSNYFTKLKNLWSEYDVVVPAPTCICPKSKDYTDHIYELRLIQFLSGLNDSYDQARRQILLKGVTPTINQAYAMIVEDEIQHLACMTGVGEKVNPIAMQVNRNAEISYGNQNYKGKKCDYCHFSGHTRENCYKLIGYPTDWKQRRKGNYNNENSRGAGSPSGGYNNGHQYGSQVRTNFTGSSSCGDVSQNASQTYLEGNKEVNNVVLSKAQAFTDGEYKQIMKLLNKDPHEMKQVNMSANESVFSKSRAVRDKVHLPTGAKTNISHIGEAFVFEDAVVQDDLHSGKVKGIGKEKGGLYIFKGAHGMQKTSKAQTHQSLIAGVVVQDSKLWHKRLGHPSAQVLKSLSLLQHNKT